MITEQQLRSLLEVIKRHEAACPNFRASEYTDEEWDAITSTISHLQHKERT